MKKIPRERLDAAREMVLAGNDERQIQRAIRERFGCSLRQARRYIALVRKRLAEEVRGRDPDAVRAEIDSLLLHAVHLAVKGSELYGPDVKGLVQALKTRGELYGVFAPKRFEHSGRIETVDVDALADKIGQLAAGSAAVVGRLDSPQGARGLEPGGEGES